MRTRVKICGITRLEDARAAVSAGADAIGLVFWPSSPRFVSAEQAQAIASAMPPFVAVVGLFVDAVPTAVHDIVSRVNLALLQFHGSESPEQCRSYGKPYIKAISMREDVNLQAEEKRFGDAAGLLLDTFAGELVGGSGRAFDWSRIPSSRTKPIVLAGGLTPENVSEAIRRVHPEAVDVSSGVEASKGIKDPKKITAFMQAVRDMT
jgi:phosphoribosylanthranilate isomerase